MLRYGAHEIEGVMNSSEGAWISRTLLRIVSVKLVARVVVKCMGGIWHARERWTDAERPSVRGFMQLSMTRTGWGMVRGSECLRSSAPHPYFRTDLMEYSSREMQYWADRP